MDTKEEPGFGPMTGLFQKTDLPPKITIALKALLLYVLFIHRGIFLHSMGQYPFLPFLSLFDRIPPTFFSFAIVILFLSIVSVLLKKGNYRILSLTSGLMILTLILASKHQFSNSLLFVSCLLILIGFYRDNTYIFRIQISLLYLGASINKMFDPDWWNGHFFDFFFRDVFDVSLYQSWIAAGNLTVAKTFGITTIFMELLLGIIVLIPRLTRLTIILGLIFHFAMLIITSGRLSTIFLYIMSAAFLLISNLKIKLLYVSHRFKYIPKLLSYLDLSDSLIAKNQEQKTFSVTIEDETYTRTKALAKLLLSWQCLFFLFFTSVIFYRVFLPSLIKMIRSF